MKQLQRITLILVSLSLPIFFLLTAVRALFTPLYPMLEYRVPGFPDDIYGFTNAERLDYALIAINYITDPDVALTALSSLQF
ncbi:MAG: hypothetical protein HPY76_13120, partial [Anaerolineae bacterium]|nr:hypothetical protein [Anaerolineae bacterium]